MPLTKKHLVKKRRITGKMYGGNKDECYNETDPISIEDIKDIDPQFIFKKKIGKKTFCYDIRLLSEWVMKNPDTAVNPFTNIQFDKETLDAIKEISINNFKSVKLKEIYYNIKYEDLNKLIKLAVYTDRTDVLNMIINKDLLNINDIFMKLDLDNVKILGSLPIKKKILTFIFNMDIEDVPLLFQKILFLIFLKVNENGQSEFVKFLIKLGIGNFFDITELFEILLMKSNDLKLVKYFHTKGATVTKKAIINALKNSSITRIYIIKYLINNGAPIDREVINSARTEKVRKYLKIYKLK